jgi:hypothetical protein
MLFEEKSPSYPIFKPVSLPDFQIGDDNKYADHVPNYAGSGIFRPASRRERVGMDNRGDRREGGLKMLRVMQRFA